MPQDERGGFFMYIDAQYNDGKFIENTWHWIEES
jgi:hypothetical protein